MNALANIYVAGHRGLVGTALVRNLRAKGFDNFVTCIHAELIVNGKVNEIRYSQVLGLLPLNVDEMRFFNEQVEVIHGLE